MVCCIHKGSLAMPARQVKQVGVVDTEAEAMAPKLSRKTLPKKKANKVQVVASESVVKTKTTVVQLTTAELELESGSTVQVEVEVDGSDVNKTTTEQKDTPVVPLQSQETQDPNEEEDKKAKAAAATAKEKKKKKTSVAAAEMEKEKRARGRSRRKRRGTSGAVEYGGYKRYVWRVLKQVHPDMGASGSTMVVLDMMMADMFERLAEEASRLSKVSGRATLTSREVQSAVRLVLPGDLAKHAISNYLTTP